MNKNESENRNKCLFFNMPVNGSHVIPGLQWMPRSGVPH